MPVGKAHGRGRRSEILLADGGETVAGAPPAVPGVEVQIAAAVAPEEARHDPTADILPPDRTQGHDQKVIALDVRIGGAEGQEVAAGEGRKKETDNDEY